MMLLVLDASVIVKWFLQTEKAELHVDKALEILNLINDGSLNLIQPPHWLAETAGVLIRVKPQIAMVALDILYTMNFKCEDELEIYRIACTLSAKLDHHMFDTLYHAVALLYSNSKFITADDKYYKKAYRLGNIELLNNFSY